MVKKSIRMALVDEKLYSEGAGPATWAVVVLSTIAATTSGSAWIRSLSAADPSAVAPPGGAVSSAIAAVVAVIVGLVGLDTLFRRRLVLTPSSLRVGRESVPLSRLARPVLSGDRIPTSIRGGALARKALPPGCRALGNLPNAGVGQHAVTVVSIEPREVLVVYSWRPQVLADVLDRALDAPDEEAEGPGDLW